MSLTGGTPRGAARPAAAAAPGRDAGRLRGRGRRRRGRARGRSAPDRAADGRGRRRRGHAARRTEPPRRPSSGPAATPGARAWRGSRAGSASRREDLERQLDTFSGGELTRASLTRALAGEPDLLLLDEPTNHLDVDSIEWLEEYLDGLDASLIFVSHDRWFLESVATSVLELERGKGRMTKGSYSHWRLERAERMAAQADLYERQQQELAHLQRFVDRFRYGTKSRQAQSKLKAMARIERVERPREQRSLRFDFPPPARSGRVVMEAEGLSVSVAGRELVHDADFHIERGQRVALIGRNGAGKTTLLETLLGRRPAEHGRAKLGHGVTLAYYSQQSLELPEHARLVDAVGARHQADRAAGTDAAGPLPVLRRPGREAGQRALRRRAAAAGAGPDRGLGRQPAGARRAHQPPRHREPRGARGRARRVPRHDPVRVPRPRPDRGAGDAHDRDRGRAAAAARRRVRRVRPRPRAGRRQGSARRHRPSRSSRGRSPAKAAAPKPARSGRSRARRASWSRRSSGSRRSWALSRRGSPSPTPTQDHTAVAEDGQRHQQLQEELAHLYREWELRVG